jgi:hypothetical protein
MAHGWVSAEIDKKGNHIIEFLRYERFGAPITSVENLAPVSMLSRMSLRSSGLPLTPR